MDDTPSVAVFLDVENLAIHAQQQGVDFQVDRIVERAREEGRVIFARAYGDFSKRYMNGVLNDLQRSVFELGQLATDIKGKNTADMQLALDALEMCLQPSAPSTVVIGAGDRDYVPLVQKLRRYGIRLIGVGLKGSISASLERICDSYWYYDDLGPARARGTLVVTAEPESEPSAPDAMGQAIELLRRAMAHVEEQNQPLTGGLLLPAMKQLDPTFSLKQLGVSTFKTFAREAEKRGAVHVYSRGMEIELRLAGPDDAAETEVEEETPEERAERLSTLYREVLAHKKVPLMPWSERERLVKALWAELGSAEEGMTITAMSESLATHAALMGIPVVTQALRKITYTLNLGRCFRQGDQERFIEDIFNDRAWASCSVDVALDRMHLTYLRGIRMDEPGLPFDPLAVAQLLFETPTETNIEQCKQYVRDAVDRRWD